MNEWNGELCSRRPHTWLNEQLVGATMCVCVCVYFTCVPNFIHAYISGTVSERERERERYTQQRQHQQQQQCDTHTALQT